jgi:multiple sugar transport system ATP-binding protein
VAEIYLRSVVKRYGKVEAVRGIDLDISDKQFVALVGPSGCGKTTTLRMIAGLEEISAGEIVIDGEVVNDVAPKDRDIAMVFQSYALYPHMTAYENMAFGLRLRGLSKADVRERIERAAAMLHISELLERRPGQLSGGQRQRVAMGRAIVRNPKLFLFDEPLSNLDAKLRVQMRTEIKRVHQKIPTTTIYVTHDQSEAMTLADMIVVMNQGRIDQAGTPDEVYHAPKTRFVAGFMGSPAMNFLDCRVEQTPAGVSVTLENGFAFAVPAARVERYRRWAGRQMLFGIRPEHINEPREGDPQAAHFETTLDVIEPMGMETVVFFNIGRTELCGRLVSPTISPSPGDRVRLCFNLAHMHLIDPQTDQVV